jgi:hypothetical protein
MRPITVTVGPLTAADGNGICTSQTGVTTFALNGALVTSGVAILDAARRVAITSDSVDNNKYFTITGTSASGNTQTEVLLGPDTATVYTNLDFKTVTSVTVSATVTGNVEVGTNGVASSAWVMFDPYSFPQIALQCDVTGSVNYTVQQTLDDPNSPTNPVAPYSVVWINNPTAALVGASTDQQGSYAIGPLFAKVTINSGTGSVRSTFIQFGSVVK